MSKKIEMGKQYRMGADIVEVLTISRNDPNYPVAVLLPCGEIHTKTAYGRDELRCASNKDLKEVTPYDDFKVDEPVMVRCGSHHWTRRHFSHTTVLYLEPPQALKKYKNEVLEEAAVICEQVNSAGEGIAKIIREMKG